MNQRHLDSLSIALGLVVLLGIIPAASANELSPGSSQSAASWGIHGSGSGPVLFDTVLLQNIADQAKSADVVPAMGSSPIQLKGPDATLVPQKVETSSLSSSTVSSSATPTQPLLTAVASTSFAHETSFGALDSSFTPVGMESGTAISRTRNDYSGTPIVRGGGGGGGGIRRLAKQLMIPAGGVAFVGLALFGVVGLTRRLTYC